MSIITDALKKAEREREMKTKQTLDESAAVAVEEESKPAETTQIQLTPVENERIGNLPPSARGEKFGLDRFQFSDTRVRDVIIVAGIVFGCLVALALLPRWPSIGRNLSVVWHSGDGASAFRMSPAGTPLGSGALRMQPAFSEDKSFVQLPFVLSGISALGKDRYAIVNDKIVQQGDSVDGAHVKDILDREVVLETRSGEIKLKITH